MSSGSAEAWFSLQENRCLQCTWSILHLNPQHNARFLPFTPLLWAGSKTGFPMEMKADLSVSHAPVWMAVPIFILQQNNFQEEDTV